jgi:hypothetical protein
LLPLQRSGALNDRPIEVDQGEHFNRRQCALNIVASAQIAFWEQVRPPHHDSELAVRQSFSRINEARGQEEACDIGLCDVMYR